MRKLGSLLAVGALALGSVGLGAGPATADHVGDLDCGDFAYYEDALAHLQAHPDDPDRLDSDADGEPCETLPRRPTVLPPPPPPPPEPELVGEVFRDVLPGGTHTQAIEAMAAAGVISGFSDGTFRPGSAVTRGQMASLLVRALDFPTGTASFTDTAGSVHQAAISALATAGVVGGFADGSFRPNDPISRGQMATMLTRAFELPTAQGSFFTDVAGTTHEAGINALAAAQVTSGFPDRTFRPNLSTPRGQTAAFLYRALAHDDGGGSPAGRTAAALLAALPVAPENTSRYDRDLFPHWSDADRDGCDTRDEVLIAESQTPVSVGAGCSLSGGRWFSYYDAATWTSPSDLQVDHVVALSEAWDSGAHAWTPAQREAFANDLGYPGSLEAVTGAVNQAKSDLDPAQWLPPIAAGHCTYAATWVAIKWRWSLTIDSAEQTALARLLSGPCGQRAITVSEGLR